MQEAFYERANSPQPFTRKMLCLSPYNKGLYNQVTTSSSPGVAPFRVGSGSTQNFQDYLHVSRNIASKDKGNSGKLSVHDVLGTLYERHNNFKRVVWLYELHICT